jgi:hypothetical protein
MKMLGDAAVKKEIEERLAKLRPESARHWGRMNAPQMVCHLSDSFRGVIGERPLSRAEGLYPRTLIKWVALYMPVRWVHGMKTMPEVDQEIGGTKPGEFLSDVAELRRLTDRFTQQPRKFVWTPHPFFLDMPDREWMRWGYLHMDHHFRQFGI